MPFADELLGPGVATRLADVLAGVRPGHPFDAVREAAGAFAPLGLRQRTDLVATALRHELPGGFDELEAVFRDAMGDPRFTGWMIWPVTEAVTARALEQGGDASFDSAMALLADLTGRLTSEFAIRGLLQANLARALPIIQSWTRSDDEHVRRLASEGTRAFLPWAIRVPALSAAPESTLPVITALYRDESEYVRRSVANHLNDLSRQHPDLAARVASEWMLAADGNTQRVVKHGLRSLVKKGHPATLALFGFDPQHGVEVEGPVLAADSVAVGGELPFSVILTNETGEEQRLVVDYVVHHFKANGGQTTKVFKLATVTLAAGQSVTYERRHSFKLITTRRYHPGTHAIEVQVNGVASGRAEFELTV
ncbi:DNA alkylation repair protein [Subtercola boreus]|uniref:DNA alkylation repair protein n=1 Tax=Subtercola boreus TaxID=120213 RepID=A0A3E0VPS7_9MICO|nr:DNA alkylation repair protein [Subtercola boreus]RFA11383.1 DNA alkylation repair protein [Subtercola boreus]